MAKEFAPNATLKMAIFNSRKRQFEIADRAGLDEPRLSQIVNGRREPTDEEKKAIAKALRKPVEDLFPMEAKAS